MISLANEALGNGYISAATMHAYLHTSNIHCIGIFSENRLAGFSVIHLLDTNTFLKAYVLAHKEIFTSLLNNTSLLAYRLHTVVEKSMRRKSLASKLIEYAEKYIYTAAHTVVSIAWINNGHCSIEKSLLTNGFINHASLHNYWAADSQNRKYICPGCHTMPCSCHAKLFIRLPTN